MDTTANALRQWASSTLNSDHASVQWKAVEEMEADKARIAELESLLEACSLRNERDVDQIAELEAQLKTANERLDIMMTINKGLFDS